MVHSTRFFTGTAVLLLISLGSADLGGTVINFDDNFPFYDVWPVGFDQYQGQVGVQSLLSVLQAQDPTATVADAQALNRSFGLELNRSFATQSKSLPADISLRGTIGNSWYLNDDWEFGAVVGGSYSTNWRKTVARARNFNFPDERTDTEQEPTQTVNMAGTASFGLKFTEDHEIETTTLWLRNTDLPGLCAP